MQGFILHIGGRLGEDAGFGRRVSSKAIPADDDRSTRSSGSCAPTRPSGRRTARFADWAQEQSDRRLAALAGVAVAREPAEAAA